MLIQGRLWWQQGSPDVPLLSDIFAPCPGDPAVFPSQMRYIISLACSGSTPGSPTSWMLEGTQEASLSDAPTTSTGSFKPLQRSNNSTPSSFRISELLTLSL